MYIYLLLYFSFQLRNIQFSLSQPVFNLCCTFVVGTLEKVGSTLPELCDCQTRSPLWERPETRRSPRSSPQQQQVQPLGFYSQSLGFSPPLFPFPSTFQSGKPYLCTLVPQAGGVLQPFPMSALTRLELNLSTKELLPSYRQTMPASGPSHVGSAMRPQLFP